MSAPDFGHYLNARNNLGTAISGIYNVIPIHDWMGFKTEDGSKEVYIYVNEKSQKSSNNIVYDISLSGKKITIELEANDELKNITFEDNGVFNVPLTNNTISPGDDFIAGRYTAQAVADRITYLLAPLVNSL